VAAKGFTVLELLLALFFLTGGIAWILQANFMSLRKAQETHVRFLLTKGVLEYHLEYLRRQAFDGGALAAQVGTALTEATVPMLNPAVSAEVAAAAPVATYTVQNLDGPPVNLKRATATVNWTDPAGRARTDTLTSQITRSGLTN